MNEQLQQSVSLTSNERESLIAELEKSLAIGDKTHMPVISQRSAEYMKNYLEVFDKGWPTTSTAAKLHEIADEVGVTVGKDDEPAIIAAKFRDKLENSKIADAVVKEMKKDKSIETNTRAVSVPKKPNTVITQARLDAIEARTYEPQSSKKSGESEELDIVRDFEKRKAEAGLRISLPISTVKERESSVKEMDIEEVPEDKMRKFIMDAWAKGDSALQLETPGVLSEKDENLRLSTLNAIAGQHKDRVPEVPTMNQTVLEKQSSVSTRTEQSVAYEMPVQKNVENVQAITPPQESSTPKDSRVIAIENMNKIYSGRGEEALHAAEAGAGRRFTKTELDAFGGVKTTEDAKNILSEIKAPSTTKESFTDIIHNTNSEQAGLGGEFYPIEKINSRNLTGWSTGIQEAAKDIQQYILDASTPEEARDNIARGAVSFIDFLKRQKLLQKNGGSIITEDDQKIIINRFSEFYDATLELRKRFGLLAEKIFGDEKEIRDLVESYRRNRE